ncbi:RagB/SusD family nutrient uptake outer membrane protein [Mucilaginibacter sp.]|uniref:RagB/SusD family nutrient uptake outer membrane protein n=1 Tax=Mucilaginibacter sp. TaxID=1882438 RepID=UPI003D0B606B
MKKHIKYIISMAAVASVVATGCKKDFFNRPPESQTTVGSYYQTTAQVQASTNALYAAPWFGFNTKVGWSISELASGNGRTGSSDVIAFGNFSVSNGNFEISAAWNSLFTVVAQANALINNLPANVPASVPANVVNNALGEARLMRGLAYFYLVRIFGNVPLVENPLTEVSNFQNVNTNPVADVYKFIIRDLKFAEANCTPNVAGTGHVSSGSASALLAKVYLYSQDYANAHLEAEKVINSGEFGLFGVDIAGKTFEDLFKIANNNNKESIIALQWLANAGYGFGNGVQASFAYSSAITQTGDGYGVLAPSFDLIDAYAANPGDLRRKGTIMLPGDYYSYLDQAEGGYTLPANASSQGTHAQIKKYVVGSPADNNGASAFQSTGMNTYIMRLSDVYLIDAEAILGQSANPGVGHGLDTGATTTDATALKYFNLVRQRAGVQQLTKISFRDIIKERRLEFAIEGDYWYDLCRLDGFNSAVHPVAISIISKQDRGDSSTDNPPVRYHDATYTPTDLDFLFPVPATEVAADPNLTKAPVPYVFK